MEQVTSDYTSDPPLYLPDPAQPEGLRGDPHQPELLDRADRQPPHILHRALGLALPLQRLGPQAGVQVNICYIVTISRGWRQVRGGAAVLGGRPRHPGHQDQVRLPAV